MKGRKKHRKRVRERDWTEKHDKAFTHDRPKHIQGIKMTDEEAEAEPGSSDVVPNATVVFASGSFATVRFDAEFGETLCRIDDQLMKGRSSVLAPGDRVDVETMDDQLFVVGLKCRESRLSRLAPRHSRVLEQVIAANIDLLVIVMAAKRPSLKPGLVDRYLIAADVGNVEPILCVNKMDLVDEEPPVLAEYRELGVTVVKTSCTTDEGIDELHRLLAHKSSVMAGQSGVGKSSLLNRIDPDLALDTQEVSDYNEKGKHTTTHARMYDLHDGIRVIDTPGIRRLGVWGVTHDELALYFPEWEHLAPDCKFNNCTHTHEPDCAVRAAVEDGKLSKLRYTSYLRIKENLEKG